MSARWRVAIVALWSAVVLALPAAAPADPTFPVMHADGGIYWRSAPDWSTAEATNGNGVYPDTTISVHCYQSGAAIPDSTNTMWEQATIASGSGTGSGWINEHYINDGSALNQPSPGVPPCVTSTAPPTTATFGVAHADGGVYWRSAPDWAAAEATSGNGVYPDTTITVTCYQQGTPVPDSPDTMWEQATIASGSGTGSGWINEHYIADGAALGQPSPGIQPCSGATPAATPVAPTSSPAAPAPTEQNLAMDPSAWCVEQEAKTFETQIREADWRIQPAGIQGTRGLNDWKCRVTVVATIGGKVDGESVGDTGPLPPITESIPIDFNAICHEQFPGARLRYVPGPVLVADWPWECVGQPGKYYPPPNLTGAEALVRDGFIADGIPSPSAGRLTLELSSSYNRGSVAAVTGTAARTARIVVGKGSRSVKKAGRYTVRVRLTQRGSHLLKVSKSVVITYTLVFKPKHGRESRHSVTATLRSRG
jgi:hypothetical protein